MSLWTLFIVLGNLFLLVAGVAIFQAFAAARRRRSLLAAMEAFTAQAEAKLSDQHRQLQELYLDQFGVPEPVAAKATEGCLRVYRQCLQELAQAMLEPAPANFGPVPDRLFQFFIVELDRVAEALENEGMLPIRKDCPENSADSSAASDYQSTEVTHHSSCETEDGDDTVAQPDTAEIAEAVGTD